MAAGLFAAASPLDCAQTQNVLPWGLARLNRTVDNPFPLLDETFRARAFRAERLSQPSLHKIPCAEKHAESPEGRIRYAATGGIDFWAECGIMFGF